MALVRQPVQGLRSLLEADSVVDVMTARLLGTVLFSTDPETQEHFRSLL